MHKLNDTAQTPHCGWIYVVPETKTPLEANCFIALVDKAMENYAINNIERDRAVVNAEIQDYICTRIPSGLCKGFVNHFVSSAREILVANSPMRSNRFVSQEAAEERASICITCDYNSKVKGGVKGNGLPEMLSRFNQKRSTSHDDDLHLCAICKCFIKMMVHMDPSIFHRLVKTPAMYPEHCWKRREIEYIRRQP